MVEAVQSRVDILSKSKKLPAGITAEKLAEAKSGLAAAKEEWAKALEGFKAGSIADAVSMANGVKEKAAKAMNCLGCLCLPPPSRKDLTSSNREGISYSICFAVYVGYVPIFFRRARCVSGARAEHSARFIIILTPVSS